MAQLEARKEALEAQLAQGEDLKVAIHPNMAGTYRERVASLCIALAHENSHAEAAALIRTLVDRIELAPVVQDGRKTLSITLHGALAGIVGSPQNAKGPLGESDPVVECTKLVAGAYNPRQFALPPIPV
jgi:site-specific DNA recombinase